jgi:sec-independent protein translocase protein TatB
VILDIAPTELLVLGTVALLVIPPKDLPRAMRLAGQWVGRARGLARQFRSGFDDMIREAEFAEMEKKWKAENERIMREFPQTPDMNKLTSSEPAALPAPDGYQDQAMPVLVEAPHITPEPEPIVEAAPVAAKPRARKKPVAAEAAAKAPSKARPRAKKAAPGDASPDSVG